MEYKIFNGNCLDILKELPADSIHCVICSPPYHPNKRDYHVKDIKWADGWVGCLGDEPELDQYISHLADIFDACKRVLRPDGSFYLNIDDSYAKKNTKGFKNKDLMGIPHRVVFALQDRGWYWRNEIIWHKTDALPSGVKDRCIRSHEYIFHLTKSDNYYYDREAIKVPSKTPGMKSNKRSVWSFATANSKGSHFAVYPTTLPEAPILASTSQHGVCADCGANWERVVESHRFSTRPGRANKEDPSKKSFRDKGRHLTKTETKGWKKSCQCKTDKVIPATVLDPFSGSGTTGVVAIERGRSYIGIELNENEAVASQKRLREIDPIFSKKAE